MLYIGIDPGLKGALACIDEERRIVLLVQLPVRPAPKGTKTELDPHQFLMLLNDAGSQGRRYAVVEHQQARAGAFFTKCPHCGAGLRRPETPTTAFSLGASFGAIRMALAAHEVPFQSVAPTVWKKAYNLSDDKNQAISLTHDLFPSAVLVPPRCRVEHDGLAEALLLAEYGRRTYSPSADPFVLVEG